MDHSRLAQIELADGDGRHLRVVDVDRWPLTIGRALDNDLVLLDPHVAAHHAVLEVDDQDRLMLRLLDTVNGARIDGAAGGQALRAGEQAPLPSPARWRIGHSVFSLRRAGEPLAAELPLPLPAAAAPPAALAVLALVALAWLAGSRWLQSDPDTQWAEQLPPLLGLAGSALAWVLVWGLLSKLFSGRFTVTPHLRIALAFWLALEFVDAALIVLAFAGDWPWLSHLRNVAAAAVSAAWVSQHLVQVQPRRARAVRYAVGAVALAGVAVTMVLSWVRQDRLVEPLYAPHLLPPSWRLVQGRPPQALVESMRSLEQPLRERAAKAKADEAP